MTAKTLVKEVTNKGNMVVLLNLQQMGLIFKNYLKKDASWSSLFTFEKMAIGETRRRREFQESLKRNFIVQSCCPISSSHPVIFCEKGILKISPENVCVRVTFNKEHLFGLFYVILNYSFHL